VRRRLRPALRGASVLTPQAPLSTSSQDRRALRIAVLSRRPNLYTTRRLGEAASARGHRLRIVDPLQCHLTLGQPRPRIWYQGRELRRPDVVLPRVGPSSPSYALAVVNQFELMGVPLVNSFQPIWRARDKLLCLQLLTRHGIAIPKTVVARNPSHLPQSLAEVGGPPVVLKLTQGAQGVGVMLADSQHAVESMLDTLWSLGQTILIQEFIAESSGRDVRALVMGGRVVAAMRRQAKLGEFRSNIHRGGEGSGVELDPEYARVAVEAARIVGLEIAGVDLLESRLGPRVIEINASPGFEGLEQATGLDIASLFIEHAETHAAPAALRG
jgi:ribosomal protein S6--L-glutamate ligase